MKRTIFPFLFIIASCTMKMPDKIKAQNVVRDFLDSIYQPNEVQILEFKGFITMDGYREQQKQDIYRSNKAYKEMSEIDKQKFRQKVETSLSSGGASRLKGSKIICIYKEDGKTHNAVFLIDSAFKNVYGTIE